MKEKNTMKAPLLFTLIMLPFAAVAVYFTVRYQLAMYDKETIDQIIAQVGSLELVTVISVIQSTLYALIAAFLGYILARRLGLVRSWKPEAKPALLSALGAIIAGSVIVFADIIFMAIDRKTSGVMSSAEGLSVENQTSLDAWLAGILYGGVVEELLMRWLLMSLIAFLLWKIFARKQETPPTGLIIAANFIAAALFAAGHLPTTYTLFGQLNVLILVRCFLLNGFGGLIFGRLYRKYGIQYAMLCHALSHVVMKSLIALLG